MDDAAPSSGGRLPAAADDALAGPLADDLREGPVAGSPLEGRAPAAEPATALPADVAARGPAAAPSAPRPTGTPAMAAPMLATASLVPTSSPPPPVLTAPAPGWARPPSGGGGSSSPRPVAAKHDGGSTGTPPPKKAPKKAADADADADAEEWCICRGRAASPTAFMIACDYCQKWFHGVCVGVTEDDAAHFETYCCATCRAAGAAPTQRQRCANPDCPTYEWAKAPSAYCSRTCGWAVARARFVALDAAARNALPAPASAAEADLQRQLAEADAALRRCAQQLEQLAADEAAYEAQLTAAAAAPKRPGKACTFPGCEQRACAVHEDWQRRTASRLWLHFDRTVYAAEMLNERRQMLLHELERRRGVAARFLHQSV